MPAVSGVLRGLILGALAAPFALVALAYGLAYWKLVLMVAGGALALIVLFALLIAERPAGPRMRSPLSARGAPIEPVGPPHRRPRRKRPNAPGNDTIH